MPGRLLLYFFCHLEIVGKENLKELSHAIFASNHSSELDSIILLAPLNPLGRFMPMFYVAREHTFYSGPHFRWRRYVYKEWFFFLWGAYPLKAHRQNYAKALERHERLLRDGQNLSIFPEGRMTRDGRLQEGHGGVGYLALTTGVPVVPVAISGTFGLTGKIFWRRSHTVRIILGKPLFFERRADPSPQECKEAARRVMHEIALLLPPQSVPAEVFRGYAHKAPETVL